MPLGRVYVPPPWSNQANQKLIDTNGNGHDHFSTPFKRIEIKIEKAPAPTESVVPSKFYPFSVHFQAHQEKTYIILHRRSAQLIKITIS